MTLHSQSEYQISLRLHGNEFNRLSEMARGDQRSVDAVALVLLRYAICKCHSVIDFRRMLDDLAKTEPLPIPTAILSGGRGVIAELQQLLLEAQEKKVGFTAEELLHNLIERCGTASKNTVTAQLSRLPKEKNFPIRKTRDGLLTRYMAG